MTSERRNTPRPPQERVNVDDIAARRRWSRWLNCTEQQLLNAVAVAGFIATDVRRHLQGYRQLSRGIEALAPAS